MESINAALRDEVARMGGMEAQLRLSARKGAVDAQLDDMTSCAARISMLSAEADVEGNDEAVVGEACRALVSAAASASAAFLASDRVLPDVCSAAVACCLPVGDARSMASGVAVGARAQMLRLVSRMVCSPEARLWPAGVHDQAVRMAEAIAAVMPGEVTNTVEMWDVYEAGVSSPRPHGVEAAARFVARVVRGELGDAKRTAGVLKLVEELHGAEVMPEDYRAIFNQSLRRRASTAVADVQERNRTLAAFVRTCGFMADSAPRREQRRTAASSALPVMCVVRHKHGCVRVCCNSSCANVEGAAAHLVKLRRCPASRGLVYCSDACHRDAWNRRMCPCRTAAGKESGNKN